MFDDTSIQPTPKPNTRGPIAGYPMVDMDSYYERLGLSRPEPLYDREFEELRERDKHLTVELFWALQIR